MSNELLHRVSKLSTEQRLLLTELLKKDANQDQGSASQLVAYITGQQPLDLKALKGHLVENLPDHMIPSKIVQLSELPKLPNGKIDTSALPAPERETSLAMAKEETRSTVEDTLAKIWQEVLGFEPVGLHDNFFEIGGDSILSIQIVAQARNNGINFTPNQLFQHQTISELAAVIEQSFNNIEPSIDSVQEQSDEPFNFSGGDLSAEDMSNLMQQINQQGEKE